MSARIGRPDFDVRIVREIGIRSEVSHGADVCAAARFEERAGIAPVQLAGGFDEQLACGNQAADRDPRVLDARIWIGRLAPEQVEHDKGPIDPRQRVVVKCVEAAEVRAHLAGLQQQVSWECQEADKTLFDLDAFLSDRKEEISARVGIYDGLEAGLALLERQHRQRGKRFAASLAGATRPDEIPDHADIGIEHL